jgi:hypothetical protein
VTHRYIGNQSRYIRCNGLKTSVVTAIGAVCISYVSWAGSSSCASGENATATAEARRQTAAAPHGRTGTQRGAVVSAVDCLQRAVGWFSRGILRGLSFPGTRAAGSAPGAACSCSRCRLNDDPLPRARTPTLSIALTHALAGDTHSPGHFVPCLFPAHSCACGPAVRHIHVYPTRQESPPVTPQNGSVRDQKGVGQSHRGDADIHEGFITGAKTRSRPSLELVLPLSLPRFCSRTA